MPPGSRWGPRRVVGWARSLVAQRRGFRRPHPLLSVTNTTWRRTAYLELILGGSFDAKAGAVATEGISLYLGGQPETLKSMRESVAVMLVRNSGKFDFDEKLWGHLGRRRERFKID